MTNEFLKVFSTVLKDQVIKHNTVKIDGLGSFKIVHESQRQDKNALGRNIMLPPKDSIEFIAEEGE